MVLAVCRTDYCSTKGSTITLMTIAFRAKSLNSEVLQCDKMQEVPMEGCGDGRKVLSDCVVELHSGSTLTP